MTPSKRISDLALSLPLAVVLLPLIVVVGVAILIRDGRPVFYGHERMQAPGVPFKLWKFRTMLGVTQDQGVTGGDKEQRITSLGQFLRRTRLDEVPQIWNVIRGDISFVGPRPPDRRYVEMFPEIYAEVLKSRPGITGLATLAFHKTEERLLAPCRTAAETEAIYIRRCIPHKARLDLIYGANRTFCYDLLLMFATVFRRLPLHLERKLRR